MKYSKSIALAILLLFGFAGESRSATLLASFQQGSVSHFFADAIGAGILFEIGYASATPDVFDGPVFASSNFPFPQVPAQKTTNSGAGFDALKTRIADGVDDTILVSVTALLSPQATGGPTSQTYNHTFLESTWISGGTTGLPGPGLTGFVLSELVSNNPFSIRQTGTMAEVRYGLRYELFGTPQVTPVPLPAALPLLGTALAVLGFFGWRRRRTAAA